MPCNLFQWNYLRRRIDAKLQFALFAVVDRESFHQKGSESGTGSTAKGMKNQESLEADAVLDQSADAIRHDVGDLSTHGVMTPGVVIGRILLARYQLIGMEQLSVGARANRI